MSESKVHARIDTTSNLQQVKQRQIHESYSSWSCLVVEIIEANAIWTDAKLPRHSSLVLWRRKRKTEEDDDEAEEAAR
jgi:hypothetical protein